MTSNPTAGHTHQGNQNRKKHMDFPGGSDSKTSVYNVGDLGSIPGLGRSAGEDVEKREPSHTVGGNAN